MQRQKSWTKYVSKKKQLQAQPIQKVTKQLKNNKKLKNILFAIGSSLFIGIIFGLVTLYMLKQEDPDNASILHTTTDEEQNESENEGDVLQIEAIKVYVVQGGVFSSKENIADESKAFSDAGLPVNSWERDGDYYLFTGISSTLENAEKLESNIREEVYVKEWEVPSIEMKMTESEQQWLLAFLDVWKQTLVALETEEQVSVDNWKKITEYSGNISEPFQEFQEHVNKNIKELNKEQQNETKVQSILMDLLYTYEKKFNEN